MLDVLHSPVLISPAWNCHEQNYVGSRQPLILVTRQPINNGELGRFLSGVAMSLPLASIVTAMTPRRLNTVMSRIMPRKSFYAESATPKEQRFTSLASRGAGKSGLHAHAEGVRRFSWNMESIRQFGQNPKVGENKDSAG